MQTMATNRDDLIERLKSLQPRLHDHGVERLALFGSFARDQPQRSSDIDLLVEFSLGKKTYDNFLSVCDLLESSLGRKVDLLTPESLSPHIGPRILAEAQDVFSAN